VSRLTAIYHVRSDSHAIEARARGIAVEQSVEMPLSAIEDDEIHDRIVGKVEDIREIAAGLFAVRIALSRATVGEDAGQLINMLFGNTSLQDDVVLHDAELPGGLVARHGGPHFGLAGLRARAGVGRRAQNCTALKPQGLAPDRRLRRASRAAASTTSRTTTGSPTRPIRRLRRAATRLRRRCVRSSAKPAGARAMCRA
jgi:ribulose-bisphosphate carboxylase large chain